MNSIDELIIYLRRGDRETILEWNNFITLRQIGQKYDLRCRYPEDVLR